VKSLLTACVLFCCSGCITYNRDGTSHHVIIGFGIVSVNNTNRTAATVVTTKLLGVGYSDDSGPRAAVGYSSSTVIRVATNQNAQIEVSNLPLKPLTVTVSK
jgi:hypothetical protein